MTGRISVVIPAFNEERRIVRTLQHILEAADAYGISEVIVVDDGSSDETTARVAEAAAIAPPSCAVRLQRLPVNRGKGAALRAGAPMARGELVLFLDADLSVPLDAIPAARVAIEDGADIVVGSRIGDDGVDQRGSQPLMRRLAGWLFSQVRRRLIGLPYPDTQCPFKLLRRDLVQAIVPRATIDGWSFDVELLALAGRAGARVVSVPVPFTHEDGSTVQLGVGASIRVLRELWRIRAATRTPTRERGAGEELSQPSRLAR